MSRHYHPAMIDDHYYKCDNCGVDDGRKTVVWKKENFAICLECLEDLAYRYLFSTAKENETIEIKRKQISENLRLKIFRRDNFTCQKCASRSNLTLDHIKPFKYGGDTIEDNLQTLCQRCNSKKGSK